MSPTDTRRRLASIGAAVLVAAFLVGGLAQLRMETSLESFLPRGDAAVEDLRQVNTAFGGEPIVVLIEGDRSGELLRGRKLDQLLMLEGRLSELPDVAVTYGPGTVLNQIAGQMQDLLIELSGRRDAIERQAVIEARRNGASVQEASRAGQAAVSEFTARYGSLLVRGMPAGLPTLYNAQFVKHVVYDEDGEPRSQWQFVVPSPESVAVLVRPRVGLDEQATRQLADRVRKAVGNAELAGADVTVSGVPVVVAGLGEQAESEIPLIGGVALAVVATCFVVIPWTSSWRRRFLPVVTVLLGIGLTLACLGWLQRPLSLGVVAFLTVLLGTGVGYPLYTAQRADPRMVLTVAGATAAGFATLMLSPLPFVRDLGLILAVGVLVSALVGMALVRYRAAPSDDLEDLVESAAHSSSSGPGAPMPARLAALGLAVVIAATGWLALPGMALDADMESFANGLPELTAARHVESTIGSSGEVDITLSGKDVLGPQALQWSQQTHNRVVIEHADVLTPVLTPSMLLSFLGSQPSAEQIAAGVRLLPSYLTDAVFSDDGRQALLSFGVAEGDAGELSRLRDELAAEMPEPPPGYEVRVSGLPIANARAHELISGDLLWSNVAGIAAAVLVVALGLRRRSDAWRAALSACIATGAGLFVLQVAGIPLTPLTATLGALTAAVGCEFAVVLSEARRSGHWRLRRSVLLATATATAGYGALSVSQLAAIREFGLVLGGAVLFSFAAAACVAWATHPPTRARTTNEDAHQTARQPEGAA